MEKIHWKSVFDSDYLGSCDLEDGKDLKAIITRVEVKAVKGSDGKEEDRNVAFFKESIKPMILNATNCKTLKKFTKSPYINDWLNVPVQIYVKNDIKAFGEITEGLRFRDFQPKTTKDKLTPDHQSWPGAVEFIQGGGDLSKIKQKYEVSKEVEQLLLKAVK